VFRCRNSPDTQHDEPFWPLGSIAVLLWVTQCLDVDLVGLVNLVGGSVSDEHWLSSPFDNQVFTYTSAAAPSQKSISGVVTWPDTLQWPRHHTEKKKNTTLTLWDRTHLDLDLRQSQNIRRSSHVGKDIADRALGS